MADFISFYPGPSQTDPILPQALQEAATCGILSRNHRSSEFVALARETVELLHEKLSIPHNYSLFFVSSATECWEIIAQSFINEVSYHVYNGAFGEKWMQYRQKIAPNAFGCHYPYHRMLGLNKMEMADNAGVICLTQNETSNGTQVKNRMIRRVKTRFPKALLAVDATSSMGGAQLDWLSADIWFASVQKCFGLPAGMALMVCSPKAIEKAEKIGQNRHYNSLIHLAEQGRKFQTTHTPNVLGIFLLNRVMKNREGIEKISNHLIDRAAETAFQLQRKGKYQLLAHDRRLRSATVLAIKALPEEVEKAKAEAAEKGFLLGNGYGKWKETTFRIANFPAISDEAMERLTTFLIGRKKKT